MAIETETRLAGPYTGDGSQTVFTFAFKVFQTSDIQVWTSADGLNESVLPSTNYTVTLNANQETNPGGTVTLNTALTSGYKLSITSAVAYLQPMVLTNQGGFYPEVLNTTADRQTILTQQLKTKIDRAVRVPLTSSETSETLLQTIYSARDTAVAKAGEATQSAEVASQKETAVTGKYNLIQPHFAAIDAIYADRTNVDTVAGAISNVNAVGSNIAKVSAVADNETNINTVEASLTDIETVADDISNVNSVGVNIAKVINVNDNLTVIGAVSDNATNINIVAGDKVNIDKVATVYTKVDILSNYTTEISTVSGGIANVNAVGSNIGNVNAVAGNETNINAVKANASNINTVAGAISNVNSVGASIGNVNSVAADLTKINAVHADLTNIDAVAADLTNINAASSYAAQAKTYAIGSPSEPVGAHSAKWYSEHMALTFKGEYSATTTYGQNEFISSTNSGTTDFYISLVNSNVGNPLSDTTKWGKLFTVTRGGTVAWGVISGQLANQSDLADALAAKQPLISDLTTIRSGAALGATAQQPATTLAGYGITDASISGTSITLGSDTVKALPSQSGMSNKFLMTNGTDASWETVNSLPAQSASTANKFLKSTGTAGAETWDTVDALPSQAGHANQFLRTDGETASWTEVPIAWGNITGEITAQTDLKNALDAKADSYSLATNEQIDAIPV